MICVHAPLLLHILCEHTLASEYLNCPFSLGLISLPAYSPLTNIFKHGIWLELESITDPELKELAEFLPLAALQSRAPSTA